MLRFSCQPKLIILASMLLAACEQAVPQTPASNNQSTSAASAPEAQAALTIAWAPVETREVIDSVPGTGTIGIVYEQVIGAETSGLKITEIHVTEGEKVTAGQVLANLESTILQAQIEQARAQIAEAVATLDNARGEVDRSQALADRDFSSRQLLEQRRTTAAIAAARLAQARGRARELEARLEQTEVVAPTNGIISKRTAQLGMVPNTGGELFRIMQDGLVGLNAEVSELELHRVAAGQEVSVRHGSRIIAGTVGHISPLVDRTTRLGLVRVHLPDDAGLWPGMFAHGDIIIARRQVSAIPLVSVIYRNGQPRVFKLLDDNRVAEMPIVTGAEMQGWVEVRDGISAGDRVVTSGAGFLGNGDLVRIADSDKSRS